MATSVKIQNNTGRVKRAIKRSHLRTLPAAGAYIRKVAQNSIKKSKKYADPGKPPHTRAGSLKRSIEFDADSRMGNVVVGPRASWITTIGSTHEFGKTETGAKLTGIGAKWRIRLGGFGPAEGRVREDFGPKGFPVFDNLRFMKLDTSSRVRHARHVIESWSRGAITYLVDEQGKVKRAINGPRKYPRRPFMARALEVSKERIPEFWERSITD